MKYTFLTLNLSSNDNQIFEDLIIHLKATQPQIFNQYYVIELDGTPSKHLHSLHDCPNPKPENYKRMITTKITKFLQTKYHSSELSHALDMRQITKEEHLVEKQQYIFKTLPELTRYYCKSNDEQQLYEDYHKLQKVIKTDTFNNVPIIQLKNTTILRHVIDYYLTNNEKYTQENISEIYIDMIKDNYSFICCSKSVKEQTIYELVIRYYNQPTQVSINNIYDTEVKNQFYTDSVYKHILDLFSNELMTNQQKKKLAESENPDIQRYYCDYICEY